MAGWPGMEKSMVPWASLVQRLRKTPGRWTLLPEMRAATYTQWVTARTGAARGLRVPDGTISARRIARTWMDGSYRYTVLLKFEPREETDVREEANPTEDQVDPADR